MNFNETNACFVIYICDFALGRDVEIEIEFELNQIGDNVSALLAFTLLVFVIILSTTGDNSYNTCATSETQEKKYENHMRDQIIALQGVSIPIPSPNDLW